MAKRPTCTRNTKTGRPCRAPAMPGTDHCIAHAPKETRESLGFGGAQPGAGRPRVPKSTDVARQLVTDYAAELIRPHFRALGYEIEIDRDGSPYLVERPGGGAKLHGTSKTGVVRVSEHDDIEAMQRAAERIMDRVLGRPRQAHEHTGSDGGPITFAELMALADEDD